MSSAAQIDSWHRKRGFHLGIGYHYVVRRNGEIEPGRPEWMVGAHCKNHNAHSIGVCYEGGLDIRGQPADTRTAEQKAAMRQLLEDLRRVPASRTSPVSMPTYSLNKKSPRQLLLAGRIVMISKRDRF